MSTEIMASTSNAENLVKIVIIINCVNTQTSELLFSKLKKCAKSVRVSGCAWEGGQFQ